MLRTAVFEVPVEQPRTGLELRRRHVWIESRPRMDNTFGALNVRDDFLHDRPEVVASVLQQYERARVYTIANPGEAEKALAEASGLELRVAQVEIGERTRFPDPTPGAAYRKALSGVVTIVREEHLATPGADLDAALAAIVEPHPARGALGHG